MMAHLKAMNDNVSTDIQYSKDQQQQQQQQQYYETDESLWMNHDIQQQHREAPTYIEEMEEYMEPESYLQEDLNSYGLPPRTNLLSSQSQFFYPYTSSNHLVDDSQFFLPDSNSVQYERHNPHMLQVPPPPPHHLPSFYDRQHFNGNHLRNYEGRNYNTKSSRRINRNKHFPYLSNLPPPLIPPPIPPPPPPQPIPHNRHQLHQSQFMPPIIKNKKNFINHSKISEDYTLRPPNRHIVYEDPEPVIRRPFSTELPRTNNSRRNSKKTKRPKSLRKERDDDLDSKQFIPRDISRKKTSNPFVIKRNNNSIYSEKQNSSKRSKRESAKQRHNDFLKIENAQMALNALLKSGTVCPENEVVKPKESDEIRDAARQRRLDEYFDRLENSSFIRNIAQAPPSAKGEGSMFSLETT
ncbi:hypothetical protein SNEBB_008770 [Seison nebaliae]|nr:hypothetical protein SNEBB_008770 [Seison nebaliae]